MTTVAIDFGTSNTVVSIIEPDTKQAKSLRFEKMSKVFRMKLSNGSVSEIPVIPSLVFIKEGHELILGEQVRTRIYLDIGQVLEMGKAELSYDRTRKMTSGVVKSQNTYKSLTYELDWQENIIKSACIAQLNPLGTVGKDRLKVHLEIDYKRMLLVTVTDLLTQQVLVYKKSIVQLY